MADHPTISLEKRFELLEALSDKEKAKLKAEGKGRSSHPENEAQFEEHMHRLKQSRGKGPAGVRETRREKKRIEEKKGVPLKKFKGESSSRDKSMDKRLKRKRSNEKGKGRDFQAQKDIKQGFRKIG